MAKLTLLTSKATMHNTGGLNWGSNKKNHTRKLDAYIPIHIKTVRNNPGFFSPKRDPNPVVTIVWDDGVRMYCKFEGTLPDRRANLKYPKQISSFPHKDILGKYFRKRLGITGFRRVFLHDLTTYGRSDIDLVYDPVANVYNADFHV